MAFSKEKLYKTILFFFLIVSLSGCFNKALRESGVDSTIEKTVYNRVAFKTYEGNLINYSNRYSGGVYIPAGSPCTIKAFTNEAIKFTVNGDEYILIFWLGGKSPEDIKKSFRKYFLEDRREVGLDKVRRAYRDSVSSGVVEVGMSKEEVLLSIGYPAFLGAKNPTIDDSREVIIFHNDWFYYSKGKKVDMLLKYKAEKLHQIKE